MGYKHLTKEQRYTIDALEIREQNWSKYATLDDFMPEIVKAINDYQL